MLLQGNGMWTGLRMLQRARTLRAGIPAGLVRNSRFRSRGSGRRGTTLTTDSFGRARGPTGRAAVGPVPARVNDGATVTQTRRAWRRTRMSYAKRLKATGPEKDMDPLP